MHGNKVQSLCCSDGQEYGVSTAQRRDGRCESLLMRFGRSAPSTLGEGKLCSPGGFSRYRERGSLMPSPVSAPLFAGNSGGTAVFYRPETVRLRAFFRSPAKVMPST